MNKLEIQTAQSGVQTLLFFKKKFTALQKIEPAELGVQTLLRARRFAHRYTVRV
jgi:hypothetical protein